MVEVEFKVELVDLFVQYAQWIDVAVAAGGTGVDMAYQSLGDQNVQSLHAKLLDEGVSEAVKGGLLLGEAALLDVGAEPSAGDMAHGYV